MIILILDIINNIDIINHIYTFLSTVDDKTVVACINRTLNNQFKKKSYFEIQRDNLRLKISNSNRYGLFTCLNAKCREEYNNMDEIDLDFSLDKKLSEKKIVGNILFFYPRYLRDYIEDNDYYNSSEYIIDRWHRQLECKNGPKIKRFIPYCIVCMHRFVNYGYRNDGNKVPYGYSCEFIKNL